MLSLLSVFVDAPGGLVTSARYRRSIPSSGHRAGSPGWREMMTLRNILLGATMLCAATAPAYAFAQDSAPADDAAAPADNYGGEIIVTASQRSQTLQDTPVPVSVATAAALENSANRDRLHPNSSVPPLPAGTP